MYSSYSEKTVIILWKHPSPLAKVPPTTWYRPPRRARLHLNPLPRALRRRAVSTSSFCYRVHHAYYAYCYAYRRLSRIARSVAPPALLRLKRRPPLPPRGCPQRRSRTSRGGPRRRLAGRGRTCGGVDRFGGSWGCARAPAGQYFRMTPTTTP